MIRILGMDVYARAFAAALLAVCVPLSARADMRSLLPLYERYVAIDGACAWPQLTLLPGGDIAALIWPESNHGLTEGAVECWLSQDGGQRWRRAGIPVPNEPGTNRMNLASGLAPDGSLVAVISGWDRVRPKVRPGFPLAPAPEGPLRGKSRDPIPAISRDGGRSWTRYAAVPPLPGTEGAALIPHGRIRALQDGRLGAMFYGAAVYFFTSQDGGRTWNKHGELTKAQNDPRARTHNETDWILLDNGDIFAVSRTYGDRVLEGFRSTDGGITWKSEGALTLPSQHPGSLARLPDGQLLLSYGTRNTGQRGISIRVADPTARRWSDPACLVEFEELPVPPSGAGRPTDGGYPSTVVLGDGSLLTAYYNAGVPGHQRYHMGVVRWRLDPAIVRRPLDEGNFRKELLR